LASVDGGDILAAHLEEVADGTQPTAEEILAALKARGFEFVTGPEAEPDG
jgi:hypothetical protein